MLEGKKQELFLFTADKSVCTLWDTFLPALLLLTHYNWFGFSFLLHFIPPTPIPAGVMKPSFPTPSVHS